MGDKQEVIAANAAFYKAFEKRDPEAMAAVWSHGTGTICIHPGRAAIHGWSEIAASWSAIFRGTRYLEIDIEVLETEVHSDFAYVVLIETVMQVSGGRQMVARSMATNVYQRMAGQWYLMHHHGSPIAA